MKVKVTLMAVVEPEIRRTTLENNPGFVDFKKKVLELFGENDKEQLFLWKDDEEDFISMSSEEEFQEALKNASDGLLRIFIKRNENFHDAMKDGSVETPEIQKGDEINNDDSVKPREFDCRLYRGKRRCTGWKTSYENREDKGCRGHKHGQISSVNGEWERMRRALRTMKRIEQPMQRCRGWRRRWESAEDEMCEQHWSGDEHRFRHCRLRQSRVRHQDLSNCKMARSMYCRRRANSSPPLSNHRARHAKCGTTLYGLERKVECRRSALLPPLGRSLVCFQERDTPRRHWISKRKRFLKFELKNAKNHKYGSEYEPCNDKEKCLGRRCKSYRRKARMSTNYSVNNDTSVSPEEISEPGISKLVRTINFEDDGNDEEIKTSASADDCGERKKGKCRHKNRDHNDSDQVERNCSVRTKRKYQQKYRVENESFGDIATEFHSNPTAGWEEESGNKDSPKETHRRERRCNSKEYERVLREESTFSGRSDENRCWRSLTIKVGMNGIIKPRRLSKFLNQKKNDLNGYKPDRKQEGHNEKCHVGRYEWRFKKMLNRQARGGLRASKSEFSLRDVGAFGGRGWRRRECPW